MKCCSKAEHHERGSLCACIPSHEPSESSQPRVKKDSTRAESAEAIVDLVKSQGGVLELEDLKDHLERRYRRSHPIQYTYNHPAEAGDLAGKEGVPMYECPPNGQGLTTLVALGILDELQNQGKVGDLPKSTKWCRVSPRAYRSSAPRLCGYSIPRFRPASLGARCCQTPPTSQYLAQRAQLFDPTKASVDLEKVVRQYLRHGLFTPLPISTATPAASSTPTMPVSAQVQFPLVVDSHFKTAVQDSPR